MRFSPKHPSGSSRPSSPAHQSSSSRATAYTAWSLPPWCRWSPSSSPTTPLPSPPFLGPGSRTSIEVTGALAMPVALVFARVFALGCSVGTSRPTLTLRMVAMKGKGMP